MTGALHVQHEVGHRVVAAHQHRPDRRWLQRISGVRDVAGQQHRLAGVADPPNGTTTLRSPRGTRTTAGDRPAGRREPTDGRPSRAAFSPQMSEGVRTPVTGLLNPGAGSSECWHSTPSRPGFAISWLRWPDRFPTTPSLRNAIGIQTHPLGLTAVESNAGNTHRLDVASGRRRIRLDRDQHVRRFIARLRHRLHPPRLNSFRLGGLTRADRPPPTLDQRPWQRHMPHTSPLQAGGATDESALDADNDRYSTAIHHTVTVLQ